MVARQKLFQDRLVLEQLFSLKGAGEKSSLSATGAAEPWAESLAQASARLAGDDPSVRKRWKCSLHPSSVQLGRHFQRSVVQSVSENRTALKFQPLYVLPGVSEFLAGQVSCGFVLAPCIWRTMALGGL